MDLAVAEAKASGYMVVPFRPWDADGNPRAEVTSTLMRQLIQFENIFTDYNRACDEKCGECSRCETAIAAVTKMLIKPDTVTWEVWGLDDTGLPLDLVGILYLTDVVLGGDATAHYAFFDRDLRGKQKLIEDTIDWVFEDHEDIGWISLKRLTLEIPAFAFALIRHAQKYLGFGGDFEYRLKGKTVQVEGVKRKALPWRGQDVDVLILGKLKEE